LGIRAAKGQKFTLMFLMKKRKTILMKKNQRSVVNPGGLPSNPMPIDPNQILGW